MRKKKDEDKGAFFQYVIYNEFNKWTDKKVIFWVLILEK